MIRGHSRDAAEATRGGRLTMSFSTYEDLCSLWAYLEKLDPTDKFDVKGPQIPNSKLVKPLAAIKQWKPDGSAYHHAIMRTILAYLNDWAHRDKLGVKVLTEAAQTSLGILRSNWTFDEHGVEGMAVIREAFCMVRDFGRGRIKFSDDEELFELLAEAKQKGAKKAGK